MQSVVQLRDPAAGYSPFFDHFLTLPGPFSIRHGEGKVF
jgi:hypothetical protein